MAQMVQMMGSGRAPVGQAVSSYSVFFIAFLYIGELFIPFDRKIFAIFFHHNVLIQSYSYLH